MDKRSSLRYISLRHLCSPNSIDFLLCLLKEDSFSKMLELRAGKAFTNFTYSFGPVQAVLPYFERYGATPPSDTNPAEFVLETVGAGINARKDNKENDWATIWKESPEAEAIAQEIAHIQKQGSSPENFEDDNVKDYNSSLFLQTWLLTVRIMRNQWRNVPYMYSKIWVHIVSAILVGLTFFQLGTGPQDLQNR